MKHAKRKIALERMHVLINSAISNARLNPDLAQRQASLARRISTHYRIKMPYELRINFCKKCKNFIAPGINSRIRLGRTPLKSIRITCNFCEHTYRKVIAKLQIKAKIYSWTCHSKNLVFYENSIQQL